MTRHGPPDLVPPNHQSQRWLINKLNHKPPWTLALSDPASQPPLLSFEALGGLILISAGP